MQVQFLDSPEFTIDSSGTLRRRGSWLITADNLDEDLSLLAQHWAGKAGDPWRNPNTEGNGYQLDASLVITHISSQAADSRSCIVTFEGTVPSDGNSSITPIDESIQLERRKDC